MNNPWIFNFQSYHWGGSATVNFLVSRTSAALKKTIIKCETNFSKKKTHLPSLEEAPAALAADSSCAQAVFLRKNN